MLSNDQLEQLCRMQAVAIDSGLDRVKATDRAFLAEVPPRIADELRAGARRGEALSETLSRLGAVDGLSIALISAGEARGGLADALLQIADRCAERRADQRALLRRLLYPAILLILVIVVPPLPLLVTSGVGAYVGAVAVPLIVVGGLLVLTNRIRVAPSSDPLRAATVRALTTLPVLGGIALRSARARFMDALGACVRAGLDLHAALEWARRSAEHPKLARIEEVSARLRGGAALHEALGALDGLEASDRAMVAQAEVAGALDEVLPRIAKLHRESARERAMWAIRIGAGVVTALVMVAAATAIVGGFMRYLRAAGA